MGGGSGVNDPAVVAAFHRDLARGGLLVALLAAVVFVSWRVCLSRQLRAARPGEGHGDGDGARIYPAEPAGRRLLRAGFGLLWVFDGVLQGQASMPLGMVPKVIDPAAATSPSWVRDLVGSTASVWTHHPSSAAASAVWIQVGLGLLLLVSSSGVWSRLAGAGSAAWGLIVWIFGEAFGGVFAPGLSWMFGAPGAALLYVVAGMLLVLPEPAWRSPSIGRWTLRGSGAFFVGMAVLQAWPGRGFWKGQPPGVSTPGPLTAMVTHMAQTPQPRPLATMVRAFGDFDAAHGWAVNLFVVVALAACGSALLSGRRRAVEAATVASAVVCVADWLLAEDLGFMGGVGTDPNSMIPLLLLLAAGFVVSAPSPAPVVAPVTAPAVSGWRRRLAAEPVYAFRVSAALAAVGVILVGAAPMLVAATQAATA